MLTAAFAVQLSSFFPPRHHTARGNCTAARDRRGSIFLLFPAGKPRPQPQPNAEVLLKPCPPPAQPEVVDAETCLCPLAHTQVSS